MSFQIRSQPEEAAEGRSRRVGSAHHVCCPSFETRPFGPLLRMRAYRHNQLFRIFVTRASMSSLRALYHFQSGWISVATLASVVKSFSSYLASSFTFLLAGEYHTPSATIFCTSGASMASI